MTPQRLEQYADEFDKSSDRLTKLIRHVVEKLEQRLRQEGIMARVSARVKSLDSLKMKLQKMSQNPKKAALFEGGFDVFANIGDLAAARVMTYVERDREKVEAIVRSLFSSPHGVDDFGHEIKEKSDDRIRNDDHNYYRATHMQIRLKEEDLTGDRKNLKDDHCELQITSMLAHVWNEIEHDIVYKGQKDLLLSEEMVSLESLGLLTKAGDNIILNLIEASQQRETQNGNRLRDSKHLSALLEDHFGPDIHGVKVVFSKNADTMLNVINQLELSWQDVASILKPSVVKQFINDDAPRFEAFCKEKNLGRPHLTVESCDMFTLVIVAARLDELVAIPNQGRGPRPRHLAFAHRWKEFLER